MLLIFASNPSTKTHFSIYLFQIQFPESFELKVKYQGLVIIQVLILLPAKLD